MKAERSKKKARLKMRPIFFNIKRIRLMRGHTLDTLARRTGLSKGLLSKCENGGNMTIETLYRIVAGLNTHISVLTEL